MGWYKFSFVEMNKRKTLRKIWFGWLGFMAYQPFLCK